MSPIIAAGRTLELAYPAHNRFGVPLEFVERTIEVKAVQNFDIGLPIKHFLRRPTIRRGRLLLLGIDQDTKTLRRFWFEARQRGELPEYRLGLYDPQCRGELVDWVGRIFGPTEHEQLRMKKLALKWLHLVRERGDVGLRLAAFPGVW